MQDLKNLTTWHIATAAEAMAAAQFARCGWDVSVQYGANQPEYDLMVTRGDDVLKISVKGSRDGGWGLTQSFIRDADYHGAVDKWLKRHGKLTIFCFVQFKEVPLAELPRIYLATPQEIGRQMKESANGRGDTILHERKVWSNRAFAAGTVDEIPNGWIFTARRLEQMAEVIRSS